MTTPTMTPAELEAWTQAQLTCSRCPNPITRKSTTGMCRRCFNHDQSQRRKQASKPTDAQRAAWGISKLRTSQKSAKALVGECVHRWVIPSFPDAPGAYTATCRLCGEVKVHRPWALEDQRRTL